MIPKKTLDDLMKGWRRQTLIDLRREAALNQHIRFELEYPAIAAVMKEKLMQRSHGRQAV